MPTSLRFILLVYLVLTSTVLSAQHTAEENLSRDTASFLSKVSIGGYGNARYERDFNTETSIMNLDRFVLFTGYKFNKSISLFSELEVEDAKSNGEGGEVALEQCYLKFNINPRSYFTAGLFIPRIGILNENHLPDTYNGNERNKVETYIIPTTWRELGIGYYANAGMLNYSVAILNGLNSSHFEHGSLLREGRAEGRDATANNLAITGSLQIYNRNLKTQVSAYYGGTVGLSPRQADSLRLTSGVFGTPVMLTETNVQYQFRGFSIRALGCYISIPDASDINLAYANNTPESAYGVYGEIAYNILYKSSKQKALTVFARYEKLDMNAEVPKNGIIDETLKQEHVVTGISYQPVKNVIIKGDVRLVSTGDENPALLINPDPNALPYEPNNTILNLGLGFSF